MIGWPLLKLSMGYDLDGNRNAALRCYHQVLAMDNPAGAQFLARKYIKDPVSKGDAFIAY